MNLLLLTDAAVYTVWWVSLAVGVLVIIVVAALLTLIVRTARDIDAGAAQIWLAGKHVANNTIHIALLNRTNQVAGEILNAAGGIVAQAKRIEAHAAGCPGCPMCTLAHAKH
ncbi:MAG: hypothetical protein ACR2PL_23445 [Dehalococcoidia bacterium]